MISPDIRVFDLEPEHLRNMLLLWDPPVGTDEESGALGLINRLTSRDNVAASESPTLVGPPVVVLTRAGKPIRAFSAGRGRIAHEGHALIDQAALRQIRKERGAAIAIAVDVDRLPHIWAELQARIDLNVDLVAQCLAGSSVIRAALGRDLLVSPRIANKLPLPRYELLQASFNRLLPNGQSFVFYIVDGGRIWTSIIGAKAAGDLDLITSHLAIADQVQFSSIRRDAPAVLAAVRREFGPPHAGIFLPLSCWHKFISGDRSAIARALASKQAVLDPRPPWLTTLVGAGAVTDAAARSAHIAGKLISRSPLASRLVPKRIDKLARKVSNQVESLDVDVWAVINWAQHWTRRIRPLLR